VSYLHRVIIIEGKADNVELLGAQLEAWTACGILTQATVIAENCVPLDHTPLSPHMSDERDMGIAVCRVMHGHKPCPAPVRVTGGAS
jgi:hypothetical protein